MKRIIGFLYPFSIKINLMKTNKHVIQNKPLQTLMPGGRCLPFPCTWLLYNRRNGDKEWRILCELSTIGGAPLNIKKRTIFNYLELLTGQRFLSFVSLIIISWWLLFYLNSGSLELHLCTQEIRSYNLLTVPDFGYLLPSTSRVNRILMVCLR
jgi:hypothetical protein